VCLHRKACDRGEHRRHDAEVASRGTWTREGIGPGG
jgi:hypothetical protein